MGCAWVSRWTVESGMWGGGVGWNDGSQHQSINKKNARRLRTAGNAPDGSRSIRDRLATQGRSLRDVRSRSASKPTAPMLSNQRSLGHGCMMHKKEDTLLLIAQRRPRPKAMSMSKLPQLCACPLGVCPDLSSFHRLTGIHHAQPNPTQAHVAATALLLPRAPTAPTAASGVAAGPAAAAAAAASHGEQHQRRRQRPWW